MPVVGEASSCGRALDLKMRPGTPGAVARVVTCGRPSQEWLLWGPLVSDIRRSTSRKLRAEASGQRGPALPLLLLPEPGERGLPFPCSSRRQVGSSFSLIT